MKLDPFLKGLLTISLCAALIMLFVTNTYTSYKDEMTLSDYNGTRYEEYQQLDGLHETLNETHQDLETLNNPYEGLFDKLSAVLGSAVGAIKTVLQSVGAANSMVNQGMEDANIGASGSYVKLTITAFLLVGIIGLLIQ